MYLRPNDKVRCLCGCRQPPCKVVAVSLSHDRCYITDQAETYAVALQLVNDCWWMLTK